MSQFPSPKEVECIKKMYPKGTRIQIERMNDPYHPIERGTKGTVAGIFADEGISGTQTKKRTEFNRMIRMCKQKKIDLILTKSISRFARNTVDCLEYVRQLKDLGIGVIFEKENINTLTMTSEFMIALYGSFAQAESESISKNVSFGVQMAFKEGKVRYNFKYLLGYRKGDDGKPEIIPEEAEIVQKIFEMFLDGYSVGDIVKILQAKGYKTKAGKAEWSTSNIRNILTNEKYVGDVLMQKTYTVDCITHKVAKKYCSPSVSHSDNMRYSFRVWLLNLGLIGDEYKNCRTHLLKHLTGDIAWRHPEDGVAQRERLRQERIAAREQEQQDEPPCDERVEPVSEVREEVGETPDENLEAAVSDCDDFEETEDEGMAMSM